LRYVRNAASPARDYGDYGGTSMTGLQGTLLNTQFNDFPSSWGLSEVRSERRRICFPRGPEKWYHFHMTKLLEEAVQKVRELPLEMQEQAARMLLAYAGDEEPILMLTPEEEADLLEAQAEMRRGEFATAAEVEAVFAKYHR
jgi:hypothetical protein